MNFNTNKAFEWLTMLSESKHNIFDSHTPTTVDNLPFVKGDSKLIWMNHAAKPIAHEIEGWTSGQPAGYRISLNKGI
jgi:hypothetical protein